MKSTVLLRIASVILLFHLAGHTWGHLGWRKADEPVQREVIRQMTAYRFTFMGARHSLGDYYEGYGWAAALAMLFFALTLWFLSSAKEVDRPLVRKMLGTLVGILLAWSAVELLFFFPFAAALTFAAAILSLIPLLRNQKSQKRAL